MRLDATRRICDCGEALGLRLGCTVLVSLLVAVVTPLAEGLLTLPASGRRELSYFQIASVNINYSIQPDH